MEVASYAPPTPRVTCGLNDDFRLKIFWNFAGHLDRAVRVDCTRISNPTFVFVPHTI